jgi:hypothetical protein
MSLAKMLLTAFVALSLAATASAQIRSATITGAVTDQSRAVAANAEVVITNSGTNVSVARFVPFRETGLAIATGQTARGRQQRRDQRHGCQSHQRCPKYDSPVLRHAAERRPAAQRDVHQHFRRSINDRQSVSAS